MPKYVPLPQEEEARPNKYMKAREITANRKVACKQPIKNRHKLHTWKREKKRVEMDFYLFSTFSYLKSIIINIMHQF